MSGDGYDLPGTELAHYKVRFVNGAGVYHVRYVDAGPAVDAVMYLRKAFGLAEVGEMWVKVVNPERIVK